MNSLFFYSILIQHPACHAHQNGCEKSLVRGGEDKSHSALGLDEAIDDERHTDCVDDVVQDKNWPDRFAEQSQFTEKDRGWEHDEESAQDKDPEWNSHKTV